VNSLPNPLRYTNCETSKTFLQKKKKKKEKKEKEKKDKVFGLKFCGRVFRS